MYFLCSFQNFYAILQKMLYINTSTSKILAAGLERTTIRLYLRDFMLSSPPGLISHYEFMILFDFYALQWNHLTGNDAILVSGYLSG